MGLFFFLIGPDELLDWAEPDKDLDPDLLNLIFFFLFLETLQENTEDFFPSIFAPISKLDVGPERSSASRLFPLNIAY